MNEGYIIKKMARIHCARGPKRCAICKKYAEDKKYALLYINPPENPQATRPMMKLGIDNECVWVTFDVIEYYDRVKDAMETASKRGLKIEKIIEEE